MLADSEDIEVKPDIISKYSADIQDIFTNLKDDNIHERCRLCFNLLDSEYNQTMLTEEYKNVINDILQIQLASSPKASNLLCQSCIVSIESFHAFKSEMREKQFCFTKFLSSSNNFTSSSVESDCKIDPNAILIKAEPEDSSELFLHPSDEFYFETLSGDGLVENETRKKTKMKRKTKNVDIKRNPGNISHAKRQSSSFLRKSSQPSLKAYRNETSENVSCIICGKLYNSRYEIAHHIKRVHEKIKPHQCDTCGRSFYSKTCITAHVLTHIPEELRIKKYQCELCEKCFFNKRSLKKHQETHNLRNVQCDFPECSKMFQSKRRMLEHKKSHMSKMENSMTQGKTNSKSSEGWLTCEICGKLIKGAVNTILHVKRIHNKSKDYQCDICGKKFFSIGCLRKHMIVHVPKELKVNKYQCDLCEKLFYTKSLLRCHRNVHTEKKIQCDYPGCEKMFHNKSKMLEHKVNHLEELRFKCPYDNCDKSYVRKKNLNLHIFTSHKKIREKCPVGNGCKFSVGRKDYMRAHLKKHSELSPEELKSYFKQLSTMNLYQN